MRRSFGLMAAGNLISALLGAAVVVTAARFLTPAVWAEAAIIIGVGPAVGVVLSLGSVSYKIREVAKTSSRLKRREETLLFNARRMFIALPLVLIGIVLLCVSGTSMGWIALLGGVRFIRGGAGVLFSGERRFGWLSIFLVAEKATCLTVIFVAYVTGRLSVEYVALAYLASYVTYFVLCSMVERAIVSPSVVSRAARTPFKVWEGSGEFGVASLVGPAQQLDVSIVSWVVGPTSAGLFGSASRMVGGLNFAGSALASVALPYFATGASPMRPLPKRTIGIGVVVALLAISVPVVTAPVVVPWLLGEDYAPAVGAISAYFVATVVLTVNQPLMSVLQARSDERFVMWVALGQSLTGLAAVGAGAAVGGATGAAVGYLFVTTVILVVLTRRAWSILSNGRSS